jgi:hypothetical protein
MLLAIATDAAMAGPEDTARRRSESDAVCAPPPAASPESARKTADEFFDRGKRLREEGKISDACNCFDASNRLAAGRGGTLLSLGICHEQEGKLVAARRELQEASAKARQDGRADRESMAAEHLSAVESRLSWLEIALPPNVGAGLAIVTLDGASVDRSTWGALPIEAGRHVLSVAAPGYRPREVEIVAAASERRAVRFEALEPLASTSAATSASTPNTAAPPPVDSGREIALQSGGVTPVLRTAALVTGIAGVALSLGMGAWALERKGIVRSNCDANKSCDSTGLDAASTGRTLIIASTVAFAVGAVGVGAWAVLPGGPLNRRAEHLHAGIVVRGTF